MTDYTITLDTTGPTPSPLSVAAGDKITFSNAMSADTDVSFPGNSPFVPKATISVPAGGTAGPKNVNGTAGTDTYDYTVPGVKRGTRSGTIEI